MDCSISFHPVLGVQGASCFSVELCLLHGERGRWACPAAALASRGSPQVWAEGSRGEQKLRVHILEPPGLSGRLEAVTSQLPGMCLHTQKVGPEVRVEGPGMERGQAARWHVRGLPLFLHI